MPSRRPSKKPSRRDTLDVDAAWLLAESSPALKPPQPPRRETMEVKLEWLEEVSPKKRAMPPPLPREEPDSTPPTPPRSSRRSHGPPRQPTKRPPALPRSEAHRVVSHAEWVAAHAAIVAKEKAWMREGARLARERRELPWERVEHRWTFETARGRETLADLFGKRSQLVVYHFLFDATKSGACPHCAFAADAFDGTPPHLERRDVAFVAVSSAPLAKIAAFARRMGWTFDWVSCADARFFAGDGAIDVFHKDASGAVFHSYAADKGVADAVNGANHVLDLVPKERVEGEDGAG